MKGTYTSLNNLRRQVFEEVARLAYEQAPYEGAKPMLLVDSEDPARIANVVVDMLAELPKRRR